MRGLAYLLGIVAGFGITLQVGMNSRLRTLLQSANTAALISFLVGTFALATLFIVTRAPVPNRDVISSVPWWAWLGGLMGAFYVAISTVVASQVGAAALLALGLLGIGFGRRRIS
jgi:transporter family-2 protein